tara:strand:- start:228 stop:746 length:519 start_codon:yes stop_codon:yes gene_type:complete
MIIPGQSLTAEPRNAPYENPPEMTKPEDAIEWHLDRLTEEDRLDALVDALELGLDVVTLTEGLLRGAVMDGRHGVDVSLIIAPVIHEFIKSTADKAGVEYEEGFPDDTEKRKAVKYQINERKARKMIAEYEDEDDDGDDVEESMPVEEVEVMMSEEMPAAPAGLMSRTEGGV